MINNIEPITAIILFVNNRFTIEQLEKNRIETIEAVEQFDYELKNEYYLSEADEQYMEALLRQLLDATRQGNKTAPMYFNLEKYKTSEIFIRMPHIVQQAEDYIQFKDAQKEVRKAREELKGNKEG